MDRTSDFVALLRASASIDSQEDVVDPRKSMVDDVKDEYTLEAYRILSHITSLRNFLVGIRKAYLQMGSRRTQLASSTSTGKEVAALTDKERDEIDFEVKTIIRQTMDRVKHMEELEKIRRARSAKNSFLERFMAKPEEEARSVILSTHRGAITWYLSKKLREASDLQRNQQEVRLMREVEKSKSMVNRPRKAAITPPRPSKAIEAEQQFESTLSKEQLQVLEQENHSLIDGFERSLDQIKGAEKALLEISALQNELMTQLTSQTYITDRLYDDALQTTESVEKGNQQLVRARKRHKSTTKFVLVFLLVMTLLLLFLDSWY